MLVFLFVAVSCASADSISVSENSSFQSVYVRGQELNLSGLTLQVTTGDKTTEIPFDNKGVTVSGYEKDTLGKQTLKIEYDGVSTEITVTVVERLVVNGALTDYLVGEEFDKSKGVVKVTDNKGISTTLPLSSDSISISGFDSSKESLGQGLLVSYNNGTEVYEGSLSVNIYAIASVDFRRPNEVAYSSHYQGNPIALGGRFVLKGTGGVVQREVAITEDMISGLDTGVATAENPSVSQWLTVTFRGEAYKYEVEIIYTDVSLFADNSEAFNSVNWEGESEPQIEKEVGELALELMKLYFEMPTSEQALLDEDTVFNVARAAMVYGFELFADNIRLFEGVFAIEYGEKVLYLESYDKVKESLKLFDDYDSAIYSVSPLLLELIEEYGDRVIYENEEVRIYFNSYPIFDDLELVELEAMLQHVVSVFDLVKNIPENWRESGLDDHADALRMAAFKILEERYILKYPNMYYLLSSWRTGDDLFDMLYTYLYEADEKNAIASLIVYGLPTQLLRLYEHILTGVLAVEELQYENYTDTTRLLYNYYCAAEYAKSLTEQKGTVENYIYFNIPANPLFGIDLSTLVNFELMFSYLRTAVCDFSEGLVDVKAYDDVLKVYVNLIQNIIDIKGYESTKDYGDKIKTLFDMFVELSPVEQYNLIAIFNSLYKLGTPDFAFDDSVADASKLSLFNLAINDFIRGRFSAEQADVYNDLILAIEVYANRFGYANWESDFISRMERVEAAEGLLEGDDKTAFDFYLRTAYNKYIGIKENLDNNQDLGEWADEFATLNKVIIDLQTAYYHISTSSTCNYNYFLASFERACELSEMIISNAPAEVVYAFRHKPLFAVYDSSDESSDEQVYITYEYVINLYRNTYMYILLYFGSSEVNIYDTYREFELDSFLSLYYDMVSAFVNKQSEQTIVFDKEKTLAVLAAFRDLDSKIKSLFITMEGGVDMYYTALGQFVAEAFSEEAAEVALKLFTLEKYIYNYEVVENSSVLNLIKELLVEIEALYGNLEGENKTSFAPFEQTYNYYVEKCEELLSAE